MATDRVLRIWALCAADEPSLPSERLASVVRVIAEYLTLGREPSPSANAMFRSQGGPPPFVQMLKISDGRVHFFYFWRAVAELCRRIEPMVEEEALESEIIAFRDQVLRAFETDGLTQASVLALVASCREMSFDPLFWEELSATLQTDPVFRSASPLELPHLTQVVLPWLRVFNERGLQRRGACLQFKEITQSDDHVAYAYLASTGWDVNHAVLQFLEADPVITRLPEDEEKMECTICFEEYDRDRKRKVTPCCSQPICMQCYSACPSCPFCRRVRGTDFDAFEFGRMLREVRSVTLSTAQRQWSDNVRPLLGRIINPERLQTVSSSVCSGASNLARSDTFVAAQQGISALGSRLSEGVQSVAAGSSGSSVRRLGQDVSLRIARTFETAYEKFVPSEQTERERDP